MNYFLSKTCEYLSLSPLMILGRGRGGRKKGDQIQDGATVQEVATAFSLQQKAAWELMQRLKNLGMLSDRMLYQPASTSSTTSTERFAPDPVAMLMLCKLRWEKNSFNKMGRIVSIVLSSRMVQVRAALRPVQRSQRPPRAAHRRRGRE